MQYKVKFVQISEILDLTLSRQDAAQIMCEKISRSTLPGEKSANRIQICSFDLLFVTMHIFWIPLGFGWIRKHYA
jgi:hypothetical protein